MVNTVRATIESMYKSKCNVFEYKSIKDPVTRITSKQEVMTLENQPCRLSFKNITSTSVSDGAATVSQVVKLFVAPDIKVNAGSKITVTQNGITTAYKSSGQPAIYTNHQEVVLELFRGWA